MIYILYCPLYILMWHSWERLALSIILLVDLVKLTKICQKAFSFKISGSFGPRPNLESLGYHKNIMCMLKIYPHPLHIGQVLRLPVAVSPDMLHNALFCITLVVSEMVGIESQVTYNLPFSLE